MAGRGSAGLREEPILARQPWTAAEWTPTLFASVGAVGKGEVSSRLGQRSLLIALRRWLASKHAGDRWLAGETVRVSRRRRQLCLVRRVQGAEFCRYRGGAILPLDMRPPQRLHAMAASSWLSAYRPKAGDVVVDAGAGEGAETFVFSQLVGPTGRVISFEPHPEVFARLSQLCSVGGLKNVLCLNVALGGERTTAMLSDREDGTANVLDAEGTIVVPVDTLDAVLDEHGVERVDLLKMNIEGAEVWALTGFRRGLQSTQNVVIACHDFLADADADGTSVFRTRAAVRSALESHGFAVTDGPVDADPWDRDRLYGRLSH
jgi:FkbM family methyltransferase